MKQYLNFMVDIETLGLSPNQSPVLEISVNLFNMEDFTVLQSLSLWLPITQQIIDGAIVDPETVEWWEKRVDRKVYDAMLKGTAEAGTVQEVLTKIYNWVCQWCLTPSGGYNQAVFWAKPCGFDFPFVDGLYRKYKLNSPFHYQRVRDMASWAEGWFHGNQMALHQVALPVEKYHQMYLACQPESGSNQSAHSAEADCAYQIKWMENVVRKTSELLDEFN